MKHITPVILVLFMLMTPSRGFGDDSSLNLGPEELVQAGGADIDVGIYSVPSFVDWNNDYLKDLVIGTGGGNVRVYLNVGTESDPQFSSYFYAQSGGSNLYCTPSGCMGCFPRVVYWDADARKDLLVGQSDGTVKIFLNVGTDEDPSFDAGTLLQVGEPGSETNIDVGSRATISIVDWNSDDRKDLAVGALDGQIRIFLNEGTDTKPVFYNQVFAQEDGGSLTVPSLRSSPIVLDIDGDGNKDLLAGNTNGQLLFYANVGNDSDPNFSGYTAVEADGVPIDLPSAPRSRPSVCYWTGDGYFGPIDGYLDVLIGASDGKVHLYRGTSAVGDINADGNVDFVDFSLFAGYWAQTDCGQCGGADLNDDTNVDFNDVQQFVENWLIGLQ